MQAPTPSVDESMRSDDSWHTASSPHAALPVLPEMPNLPDPGTKSAQKVASARSVSRLPQVAATPHKSKAPKTQPASDANRTPRDRTPIKAPGQEMHPAHHHASTAKVLDEARWLGFQSLGAQTAVGAAGPGTPSKTPASARAPKAANVESSQDFRFRFKSPFPVQKGSTSDEAGLSPSSRNILRDAAISGTPGGGSRAIFGGCPFPSLKDAPDSLQLAKLDDRHYGVLDQGRHVSPTQEGGGQGQDGTLQRRAHGSVQEDGLDCQPRVGVSRRPNSIQACCGPAAEEVTLEART